MRVTRWLIATSLVGLSGCPITWSTLQDLTPPPDAPPKTNQAVSSGAAASPEAGRHASIETRSARG